MLLSLRELNNTVKVVIVEERCLCLIKEALFLVVLNSDKEAIR